MSQDGHTICSQPDYGYTLKEGRRKVMLWSREPWEQVDDLGIDSMPPGRFRVPVSHRRQRARSPLSGSAFPGSAHGLRLDASWNARCSGRTMDSTWPVSRKVLRRASPKRLIVMGDFNQTIGPGSHARPLRLALQEAFPPSMTIVTSELAFQGRRSIDHIALSEDWAVGSLGVVSNIHEGRKLSDHFGVVAELSAQHFPVTVWLLL